MRSRRRLRPLSTALGTIAAAFLAVVAVTAQRRDSLPELTQPVNDFAHVIDRPSAEAMDRMIRALLAASGDVVVVATVPTIEGYGDIREYANKLFENHGRGIGDKEKKNGLLILLALRERRVWVEVGYGLEPFITDGFAGETSRQFMVPEFRQGQYGNGLRIGTERIIGRIAQSRDIKLDGVRQPAAQQATPSILPLIIIIFIILAFVISRIGSGPRGGFRTWGGSGWSGWSSGVGPFGGGWSGGSGGGGFGGGGGGFGGGFGGFSGGSSGGGGGGAGW